MRITLGSRIRELREERDLSLRELARKLGNVTGAHLSDIELGRRFPSDELLKRLAVPLGTTLEELQRYDSRPPVEDMKRITEANPAFGFALRSLIKKNVSAEEIMDLTKRKPDRAKENK